ncbi:PAS domain-containing protein [Fibrella sp. HMF5405]|uniref:histidine kinase n=1 Tax=Fibrella forsythiae TaxID=2817061 RepID=A0ABS3JJA3_9BACT|nr:PAS domain-containing protein [Fibrella forsythiae]
MRAILYNESSEHESSVLSQYACSLGKWIYGRALIDYEHMPEVHELERVHASIHVVARKLVRQFHEGQIDEARQGLVEMEDVADQVVSLLQQVENKVITAEQRALAQAELDEPTDLGLLTSLLTQNEQLDARIRDQVNGIRSNATLDAERRVLHNFFMQAPAAHCILSGPTHIYKLVNFTYQELIGGRNILGLPVREALPELEGQGFYELLDTVFTTGKPFVGKEVPIHWKNGQGKTQSVFINFIYQPIKNATGQTEGILVFAYEVTEQVIARKNIESSEAKFRALIEEAPIATCLFVGRELVIEIANETIIKYWGKGPEVVGKPLAEAVPELKDQPTMQRLAKGFETGEPYTVRAASGKLEINGVLETFYFDIHYKPIRNHEGDVYAIMVMGIDVTDQIVVQQQLEASQVILEQTNQRLTLALDAGKLGMFEFALATGTLTCSAQCKLNFGRPSNAPFDYPDLIQTIIADDRPLVQQATAEAIETKTTYYAEYRIHYPDGSLHWIKASGLPVYAPNGQPIKLIGVTQDITSQRMAQEELEQQVQQRTRQIQESNQDLIRSNENLQQFAYIASHDLQEPLRKIQAFSDLLQQQYGPQLGQGVDFLERIQSAASRMSTLIRDLLAFSRISTRQEATAPIPLNELVQQVLGDLELVIQETNAQIRVDPLPVIYGDRSQLGQLFHNLLNNALKFSKPGKHPRIQITAQQLPDGDLPTGIKPTRRTPAYYRVDVIDNGIGFDEKYLNRIFQVFQRLHSKSEYAGTGVGLAICEKVAANHGGAISASSEPGQGATFSVYFPI